MPWIHFHTRTAVLSVTFCHSCVTLNRIERREMKNSYRISLVVGVAETILVSDSLAHDFSLFCQRILTDVSRLVEKYTFLIGLGCSHGLSY